MEGRYNVRNHHTVYPDLLIVADVGQIAGEYRAAKSHGPGARSNGPKSAAPDVHPAQSSSPKADAFYKGHGSEKRYEVQVQPYSLGVGKVGRSPDRVGPEGRERSRAEAHRTLSHGRETQ